MHYSDSILLDIPKNAFLSVMINPQQALLCLNFSLNFVILMIN